ncbi:MAG: hypothetical protein ACOYN2_02480 [Patescibacteria group bacterium]
MNGANARELVGGSFAIDTTLDMSSEVDVSRSRAFFTKSGYLSISLRKYRINALTIFYLAPFEKDSIRNKHF